MIKAILEFQKVLILEKKIYGVGKMTEDDYVSEDKSVCPAVRKRFPL